MKLRYLLPSKFYKSFIKPIQFNYLSRLGRSAYSQEGEDLLIEKYLGARAEGFYIDIGAHHPFRFSNTYYFYKKGWSGINIEPNPDYFSLLLKYRPRDKNFNIAIGETPQQLTYYCFEEPAFNTFIPEIANKLISQKERLIRTEVLPITTLSEILTNVHLPESIDFMTIDTEGMDLGILKSNDWNRIKPTLILTELKVNNLQEAIDSDINQYLIQKNYQLVSKLHNTLIFQNLDQMSRLY